MSIKPVYVKKGRIILRTTEPKDVPGFVALFLN